MNPAISFKTQPSQTQDAKTEVPRFRILYLPSWYPHPAHPTYAIFLQEQAKALARAHAILVVPPPSTVSLLKSPRDWADRCEFRRKSDSFTELYLIGANYTPKVPNSYERICWRLYRRSFLEATRFFGAPPDLIHAHSVEAAYFGAGLSQKNDCPLVLTEHINRPALLLRTARDRQRFHYVMQVARCVMAISPMQRELLYDAGVQQQIEIVPELIDTELFSPGSSLSPPPPFRLIVVGNLIHRKGIHHLVDAVAHLREKENLDLHLEVIGKGGLRRELESKAASLGLTEVVRFHGEKCQQEVRDLLRHCHIYVSSSLTESFGVAVIEAMSVGLPVVVTRSGGPESYVTRAHGTVVEPNSTEELARGLLDVIGRLGNFDRQAQHQYIVEHFSQEVVVREITRCYSLALERYAKSTAPP